MEGSYYPCPVALVAPVSPPAMIFDVVVKERTAGRATLAID